MEWVMIISNLQLIRDLENILTHIYFVILIKLTLIFENYPGKFNVNNTKFSVRFIMQMKQFETFK